MYCCDFAMDKLGVIWLTRKREVNLNGRPPTRPIHRQPISLQGVEIPIIDVPAGPGVVLETTHQLHAEKVDKVSRTVLQTGKTNEGNLS